MSNDLRQLEGMTILGLGGGGVGGGGGGEEEEEMGGGRRRSMLRSENVAFHS